MRHSPLKLTRMPLCPLPVAQGRKIFRPNGEGEVKDGLVAGGEAARHQSVIPLLSPRCGERRGQGDERGLLKSTAAKFMAQADLLPGCVQSRLTKPRLRLSLRGAVFATKQSPIAVWRLLRRCAAHNDRGADFAQALDLFPKPLVAHPILCYNRVR